MPLPTTGVIVSTTVGSSSLDVGGVEPPSKRAHAWSFLPVSSWYACGTRCILFLLPTYFDPEVLKNLVP
jgi:hypothetical protein